VAGRLDDAYWLIRPGSAGLTQGCSSSLPLQAWAGHIVAAAHLQLVVFNAAVRSRLYVLCCVYTSYSPASSVMLKPGSDCSLHTALSISQVTPKYKSS